MWCVCSTHVIVVDSRHPFDDRRMAMLCQNVIKAVNIPFVTPVYVQHATRITLSLL